MGPGRLDRRLALLDGRHTGSRCSDDHLEAGARDQPDDGDLRVHERSRCDVPLQARRRGDFHRLLVRDQLSGSRRRLTHLLRRSEGRGRQHRPAATYSWTIDTTPPSITVTFPTNGGIYNAAGWNSGCSGGAAICGSATDPQGVVRGCRLDSSGLERQVLERLQLHLGERGLQCGAADSDERDDLLAAATRSRCHPTGTTPFTSARPTAPATPHRRARRCRSASRSTRSSRPTPIFDLDTAEPEQHADLNFVWHDTASTSTTTSAATRTAPSWPRCPRTAARHSRAYRR